MNNNYNKYNPYPPINIPNRQWPNKTISKAPTWCSVDLRDGNQALVEPMDASRKMKMFKQLIQMGFKEIEIGFPSASETDYNFVRELILNNHIPSDVTVQVLTQSRKVLIDKTIESLKGCHKAIIHLYNSTSTLQREIVFKETMDGVKKIATDGAKIIVDQLSKLNNSDIRLQYSPESFTGTELPYALEVCEAVLDVWNATEDKPVIINLPATVEMSTPNIHADQIEWMGNSFSNRNSVILSLHPHNDRGTAIAATELALMAGADRVEGTLFGNGERTGNVDLVTLGLNLFTQGINPNLDFSQINDLIETAEFCNRLPVHERHPYAGSLVHTAFSGSHQDAIRKGMDAIEKANSDKWSVPYLPIDPADIGRDYEAIIRVNSQSGKGGTAWILENDHQIRLPKGAEVELSSKIQKIADTTGNEITSDIIWKTFSENFIIDGPFTLIDFNVEGANRESNLEIINSKIKYKNKIFEFSSQGNGPISAFVNGIRENFDLQFTLEDFGQNTRSATSKAEAAAYVELKIENGQRSIFGCGINTSITLAPILAVISALNKFKD
ncbi:MAG: 2-isopropylmalate synthase [Alphaproteobacteria bacterium]|nr:2-isopropylmalate synthase [Alphaproteobacteria bacterium]MDG1882107.1 2-isopropylmalate synthase [Alphaproteobacteria bacterium]|tara:strand:- start:781 stop:2448 length:1668 start_codon:yes stop_codon:yes gene_type:complete